MTEEQDILTVSEVAKRLRVSEKTVRLWINQRKLRAIDLGKGYRIRQEDLDLFIRDRDTFQDEAE